MLSGTPALPQLLASGEAPVVSTASAKQTLRSLESVLIDLEATYRVSIVFDHALVENKQVEAELLLTDDLEASLSQLLRPFGLESREIEKGVYVIKAPAKRRKKVSKLKQSPASTSLAFPKSPRTLPSNLLVATPTTVEKTITGQVTDLSTGETLPGVNIVVKGTTVGTVTDIDGNYRLTVANEVTTLVFSSIGYERVEESVNGRSTINLSLAPDIQSLSEVVVIGYGTQEEKDLTGSVSSLEVDDVNRVGVASADQILQGRVAGVNVKQASSAPGGLTSVRIRGSNSFTGSNEPLYVINGVPVFNDAQELNTYAGPGTVGAQRINPQNPLSFLNPSDIASISVLKDASATAIYGARGSNGVIIITTKRGKSGKASIDFNAYYGVQNLGLKPDLMNARELAMYNQMHVGNPNSREQEYYFDAPPGELGEGTDWMEVVTRENAPIQDYNLGVSGGSDAIRYSIGANYFNQQGLMQQSSLKRYSIRTNIDADIGERLTIGNSLVASRTINDFAWVDGTANGNFGMGSVMAALGTFPSLDVYDENGNYNSNQRDATSFRAPYITNSPLALLLEQQDLRRTNRVLANLYANYSILDNLSLRVSVGGDVEARDNTVYYTRELLQGPRLIASSANRENFINENTLNYSLVSGKHAIEALGGFTIQQQDVNSFFLQEVNFPFDRLGADAQGQGDLTSAPGNRNRWSMVSYLGRINYEFAEKYLLTASVRADGSSRFATNNKWGVFPSAAVAWRVSEEEFLQNNEAISNLKIRASAGTVGNTEIGTNQSILQIGDDRYSFGGQQVTTFFPSSN